MEFFLKFISQILIVGRNAIDFCVFLCIKFATYNFPEIIFQPSLCVCVCTSDVFQYTILYH